MLDLERASNVQLEIAKRARFDGLGRAPKRVACVDVAYSRALAVGAAVVQDVRSRSTIDEAVCVTRVSVPYVPGFLAFRELPPMIAALKALSSDFDVVLVNGHGRAHPRRAGIATHLGVVLGVPSVGIARRRLVGSEVEGRAGLLLVEGSEVLGVVLVLGGSKFYVSPGNILTVDEAKAVVKLVSDDRGVIPLRVADELSKVAVRWITES
ncbi:MAG: endonuclease V [Fervidicoccaceae archaeon]